MKVTKKGYEFEVDQYTHETLPQLLERVKLGNDKLNKAWGDICAIKDEAFNKAVEEWSKANVLLSCYCDQLQWLGFKDCLYIENGKKVRKCLEPGDSLGCRVCPSSREYWSEELMDLPSPQEKLGAND